MLLQIAQTSFVTADERYQHGVGQILELLNTQTALANARQQRVQALADWNNARMQLAASLGKLDISFATQP
jgi:outer membrane protein